MGLARSWRCSFDGDFGQSPSGGVTAGRHLCKRGKSLIDSIRLSIEKDGGKHRRARHDVLLENIEHARDDLLCTEVFFYRAHRAHRKATEIECMECGCAVAWTAPVMANEQTPR